MSDIEVTVEQREAIEEAFREWLDDGEMLACNQAELLQEDERDFERLAAKFGGKSLAEQRADLERERVRLNHEAVARVGDGDYVQPLPTKNSNELAFIPASWMDGFTSDISVARGWAEKGWWLQVLSLSEARELGIAPPTDEHARELLRLEAREWAAGEVERRKIERAASEAVVGILYVDVLEALVGVERPSPTIGARSDGAFLIYPSAVNVLLGDPEGGKTLVATAWAAEVLRGGGSVLWVDADYNGIPATLARLQAFGVEDEALADPARFRLVVPEDRAHLIAVVEDASTWQPSFSVLDSQGEVFGLFGVNADRDAEVTPVMRATSARLASFGSAVVVIDHLAKGKDSRDYGASGSTAKKRAVDGALLRVVRTVPFAPGKGGSADLFVVKDRHGSLREVSGAGKEPKAATFELAADMNWTFRAPLGSSMPGANVHGATDLETLCALVPAPSSARQVRTRMHWGVARATAAWEAFEEARDVDEGNS